MPGIPSPSAGQMSEPVVDGRGICMYYRDFSIRALDDVGLKIYRGEIFGIAGPAGSGKTTLLKILAGRLRPTYGTIRIFGYSPPRAARKGRTGLVPDKSDGNGKPEKSGSGWLGRLFSRRPPVGLAQVLAGKPEMILLDNPFAEVDASGRGAMRDLIKSLAQEGRTVVLSSIALPEMRHLCDRVALLNAGRIEAVGSVEEIFDGPAAVRVLAPVIPELTLQRALKVIRDDMGVAERSAKLKVANPAVALKTPDASTAEASSSDKILHSLLKEAPAVPPK